MVNIFMEQLKNCLHLLQFRTCMSLLSENHLSKSSKRYLQCRFQTNNCGSTSKGKFIDNRDHLKRTKNMQRCNTICSARVIATKDLSPTVKGVTLYLDSDVRKNASFKAGQWVDMMIPEIETVGGFSICNSPKNLQNDGILELAVKFSDHPPAFWIHTKCKIGSLVDIRVGGSFFFQEKLNKNILLIAGGVGINPILSILRHIRDLKEYEDNQQQMSTTLLYSARSTKELIFQDEIIGICKSISAKCCFHLTKEKNEDSWPYELSIADCVRTKISLAHLEHSLAPSVRQHTDSYICGPPVFIDAMERYLVTLGCVKPNIFYEKWW